MQAEIRHKVKRKLRDRVPACRQAGVPRARKRKILDSVPAKKLL
jgi:hypothetical protein